MKKITDENREQFERVFGFTSPPAPVRVEMQPRLAESWQEPSAMPKADPDYIHEHEEGSLLMERYEVGRHDDEEGNDGELA